MNIIKKANVEILEKLKFVLNQMNSTDYNKGLKVLNWVSIGQHVRHIIEFYQCLFEGVKSNIIDYDARKRDLRIENDLEYGLITIATLIEKLETDFEDINLNLNVNFGIPSLVKTSFQRELTYLIEHSIHHLAIINIALKDSFPNIETPIHFGVAYSTIMHQQKANLTA